MSPITPPTPAPDRFLRMPEVERMVGLKRVSIYKRIALKDFPAQLKLARTVVVWSEREIQVWMEQQLAARDTAA
jgi:prophage regulatory protein